MVGSVKPKKYLGQHFLIDENISKKIIESIDFNKYTKVIEVGPGKGALTKHLLNIKDILTLVEIDKESIEHRETSGDKAFTNGIGKMYLIR